MSGIEDILGHHGNYHLRDRSVVKPNFKQYLVNKIKSRIEEARVAFKKISKLF
jgi:hypothetical protein